MRHLVRFDIAVIKEQYTELILPSQLPVIGNSNRDKRLGIVDIFLDFENKVVTLDFSLYNNANVNSVTDYDIRPIVKTSYHNLKTITITAISLNKKK